MVCKVVPKVASPTHRGAGNETQDSQTQGVADYETALDTAGYGGFSRSALGACACAFFTTGVENCVMSYVLPAAKCELGLSTYQAGLINMAFMSGGVASAFFWGIVGDVFGRRNILSMTLMLDGVLTLAQSMVSDYRLLLAARSINGFLIGGPSTLVFTYLSDLVGVKKRQFYLNITGMSFVAAWLILPAVAWLVIPFKSDVATILPLYSWRLYLALGSIPGFVSGLWMLTLPESPRLLTDTNRSDKALKLLARIHKKNHRKGAEFKFVALLLAPILVLGSIAGFVSGPWMLALPESPRLLTDTNRSEKALKLLARIHKKNHRKGAEFKIKKLVQENIFVEKTLGGEENRTKALFVGVLKDLKMFVSKTYAFKSSLILFVFFANMAAGFGLNLWIPELLLRMQGKECKYARLSAMPEHARLVNSTEAREFSRTFEGLEPVGYNNSLVDEVGEPCSSHMDDDVFTSGLIVGACCVLGNAACALLCARGGARGVRRAAAACALTCALACACLAACACACAQSNKIAVAAAAALNAASLNGNVLLIRLLLHALPAKLSGLGVCWGAWWGRAGGMASNMAVGVLLDFSCQAPFIAVAALLTLSIGGILVIKIDGPEPAKGEEVENDHEKNTGLDRYISTHM